MLFKVSQIKANLFFFQTKYFSLVCATRLTVLVVTVQIGTTKGTGGDVLVLEEAAYCDEGFFYETVAPILSIDSASLVAISTLTSEINFYTRLIQMVDPSTERPLFAIRCIELCCEKCKEEGKQAECVHMLHLVPVWQSEERHRKLKIMMQDRPGMYFFCLQIVRWRGWLLLKSQIPHTQK